MCNEGKYRRYVRYRQGVFTRRYGFQYEVATGVVEHESRDALWVRCTGYYRPIDTDAALPLERKNVIERSEKPFRDTPDYMRGNNEETLRRIKQAREQLKETNQQKGKT